MTTVETRRIDVAGVAPAGARVVVADVFLPDGSAEPPVAFVCLPGGGMSRRYFDLVVAGDPVTYSMARHLAAAGFAVVTIDPPGVGDSDVPDDAWSLTPSAVAAVCGHVAATILADFPGVTAIGLGHSMGALLTVYQQAAVHTYDAIALLGFAGSGLPSALTERELALAGRPERVRAEIVELARARFGRPLPQGTTAPSEFLIAVPVPPEAIDGIAASASALLAVPGLTSMIPGASHGELAAIDVPVFLGVGDRDITPPAREIPAQLPNCGDITLFVLPGSGHNHHVAPTRALLWDRLAGWARSLVPQLLPTASR